MPQKWPCAPKLVVECSTFVNGSNPRSVLAGSPATHKPIPNGRGVRPSKKSTACGGIGLLIWPSLAENAFPAA